ncbi:CBS domain-containing protein [Solimonas soli]|uniref:CBS domain-containing protein n=1 Tax=Solimonas soli TaxID=413479 RepID=UPI000484BA70|nr:CBS domain-containing protein [Solimonas soli]
MKVSEVMSRDVQTLAADATALQAAQCLAAHDIGFVPVTRDDRIIGIVTDRDIVARVLADNRDPNRTRLESIASNEPKYCYEDEDCEHVARNMDQLLVRRLPVVNRDKRLVGVVSIEDIRPRSAA